MNAGKIDQAPRLDPEGGRPAAADNNRRGANRPFTGRGVVLGGN